MLCDRWLAGGCAYVLVPECWGTGCTWACVAAIQQCGAQVDKQERQPTPREMVEPGHYHGEVTQHDGSTMVLCDLAVVPCSTMLWYRAP